MVLSLRVSKINYDGDFIPEYPKVESVEETENRIDRIDEYIARMDES